MVSLYFLYQLLVLVPAVWYSKDLDIRLHESSPTALPYRWGFTYAILLMSRLPTAIFAVAACFSDDSGDLGFKLIIPLWFALDPVLGWLIFKRNRWAWVIQSVSSLNVVLWIANSLYLTRRWREMGCEITASDQVGRDPDAFASASPSEVVATNKSIRRKDSRSPLGWAFLGLIAVLIAADLLVRIANAMPAARKSSESPISTVQGKAQTDTIVSSGQDVVLQLLPPVAANTLPPPDFLTSVLGVPDPMPEPEEVIFIGWPKSKVSSSATETHQDVVSNAAEFQCMIVRRGTRYFWRSRQNVELHKFQSGAFEWFISDASGYVKRQVPGTMAIDGASYTEHLSLGLSSITYWGDALTSKN